MRSPIAECLVIEYTYSVDFLPSPRVVTRRYLPFCGMMRRAAFVQSVPRRGRKRLWRKQTNRVGTKPNGQVLASEIDQ
jgi:hypothetical protein